MKTKELRARKRATVAKLPASLKRLPGTVIVSAQPRCIVAKCFTDKSVFAYRDYNFNSWLPKTLPVSVEIGVSGYELTDTTTEAEMAKVGKKFTNLSQIENLILRTEKGENHGLVTNGYANIFFLQVGASVFMVHAYRYDDRWSLCLYRFSARNAWYAESRFFSPAT
ncbi:MAG: hypothetical protein A3C08_01540 [Candidatus Taylorbacteria bacterium RIFCSPHIGHO2_02_FULL_47_18]|uniref:Uncharacterized protein n=1 Tax=Candidatus Taylorbacteria bacterium RIFCSPLOWO2_01_FULL_48_100 TaxID=1802322 RepID=A0A1G2NG57_9BACT|nr:MAG: hypothetical protein A2670_01450 [Candidatus Taylorbacteria bacterium RIFCSPHIGHO2_01_FULL_48_38]OHA28437.1 MAG: hypothetical protein A3C08_01540 [Candidatus Taylorbacteria bacterium RIFCSPHIGHO2_02_FULL_47_18]OHA34381.1 MAG: hypothetical protein A2938_00830 [Candidatus Taylorbacteria bacterium RIFCSPLOWO2_01_FULL_48_100]OHA40192.1 MAG: hypothetical protein A3J31_01250 [Candidatus Taylorbacteria bacterium RIFCSPLOWO2_02_FULL_48_16]OHA45473.1 MAG: hypothetical protein A3H13_01595 [Candid